MAVMSAWASSGPMTRRARAVPRLVHLRLPVLAHHRGDARHGDHGEAFGSRLPSGSAFSSSSMARRRSAVQAQAVRQTVTREGSGRRRQSGRCFRPGFVRRCRRRPTAGSAARRDEVGGKVAGLRLDDLVDCGVFPDVRAGGAGDTSARRASPPGWRLASNGCSLPARPPGMPPDRGVDRLEAVARAGILPVGGDAVDLRVAQDQRGVSVRLRAPESVAVNTPRLESASGQLGRKTRCDISNQQGGSLNVSLQRRIRSGEGRCRGGVSDGREGGLRGLRRQQLGRRAWAETAR